MSEEHKKQLNILGEIRDQIKRLADLAEPTRLIMKPPPADDALVEAVSNIKAALVSNAAPTDVIHALKQTLIEKGEESVTISPSLLIPLIEAFDAAHKKAGE